MQQLIYQIVILANAGIHTVQYIGFHGYPIKEFGHDGNSKHETLYLTHWLNSILKRIGHLDWCPQACGWSVWREWCIGYPPPSKGISNFHFL